MTGVSKYKDPISKTFICDGGDKGLMEIYTTKEMMEILKFGKTKMNALLQSGEFPAVKIGGQYRITKEALEKWMKDHEGDEIFI